MSICRELLLLLLRKALSPMCFILLAVSTTCAQSQTQHDKLKADELKHKVEEMFNGRVINMMPSNGGSQKIRVLLRNGSIILLLSDKDGKLHRLEHADGHKIPAETSAR